MSYRPEVNDKFNAYTRSHKNLHRCSPFEALRVRGTWVHATDDGSIVPNWEFRTTDWDFEKIG